MYLAPHQSGPFLNVRKVLIYGLITCQKPQSPSKVHVPGRNLVETYPHRLSPRKVHVNDPLQPLLVPALSQSTCKRPFPKVQVLGAVDQGSIPPRVSYFT